MQLVLIVLILGLTACGADKAETRGIKPITVYYYILVDCSEGKGPVTLTLPAGLYTVYTRERVGKSPTLKVEMDRKQVTKSVFSAVRSPYTEAKFSCGSVQKGAQLSIAVVRVS